MHVKLILYYIVQFFFFSQLDFGVMGASYDKDILTFIPDLKKIIYLPVKIWITILDKVCCEVLCILSKEIKILFFFRFCKFSFKFDGSYKFHLVGTLGF